MKVLHTTKEIDVGMFATFAAFLDEGDEVIVMEPFFDQVTPLAPQKTPCLL